MCLCACASVISACAAVASGSDSIVQEFHDALQRSPDTAVAVAAIKVQLYDLTGIADCMLADALAFESRQTLVCHTRHKARHDC